MHRRAEGFKLGGDLPVHRLRLWRHAHYRQGTVWGRAQGSHRRAGECCAAPWILSVNLISTPPTPTAPKSSERLIAETLHPYPKGLVIATKGGLTPLGPGEMGAGGPSGISPPMRRDEPASAAARLHLDLYQLHRIDTKVPVA